MREIPLASPSTPSIRLIKLVILTSQITVSTVPQLPSSIICPDQGSLKDVIPIPKAQTLEATKSCPTNFFLAPNGFRSSHKPRPNIAKEDPSSTIRSWELVCSEKKKVMKSWTTPNAAA